MRPDYQALSDYTEAYWQKLYKSETAETKQTLGLPHPYYVPSVEVVDGFSFPHLFYWDSYFIVQGFWDTPRQPEVVGIAENMFDLIDRLGFVPNSNSFAHLSRSQPPFLASLVMQIVEKMKADDHDWLVMAYDRLVEEYKTVWLGTMQPHNRLAFGGLSRYYDVNVLNDLAEAESGWDYTTRFYGHCLEYLPVDLNSLLFIYETSLAKLAEMIGRYTEIEPWHEAAIRRREKVNQLMWDDKDGFYYDYNFRSNGHSSIKSLASYVPMFSGLASQEQAARLVENLSFFETDYGLTTTSKFDDIPTEAKQWATPNGWAPLHDMVVDGLLRYGYTDRALVIAEKWVDTVSRSFKHSGKLYEKYNVLHPDQAASNAVYPDQHGFGWTNGVTAKFIRLISEANK